MTKGIQDSRGQPEFLDGQGSEAGRQLTSDCRAAAATTPWMSGRRGVVVIGVKEVGRNLFFNSRVWAGPEGVKGMKEKEPKLELDSNYNFKPDTIATTIDGRGGRRGRMEEEME